LKKRFSLRAQLTFFMLLFVMAMIGLIYLFQTFFLDDFYKRNKIKTLQSVGNNVAEVIFEEDLSDLLDQVSMSNEVCVRVVSSDEDYNYVGPCTLRNLDYNMINMIASEAVENGGEKMFEDFRYMRPFDSRSENVFIYSKMLNYDDIYIMILVSSAITPLNTTISTIQSQYIFIVAIVVVMTLLLTFLISRYLLHPIKQINSESKNLSKGRYDGDKIQTRSKEFEELNLSLVNANEDIQKAEKARKELLGNVSHDLRTPLTMIVGYGEMIRDLPEENNEDNINVIINEAKRLSALVDDLLDISKLEDNNVELHKEKIYLNNLLEDVYHQYEKYCEAKQCEFHLQLQENILVEVDPNRIRQVLYNFINNSLNYNSNSHPVIILGSEKQSEHLYRVFVYDNGEGIKETDREHIWDRYYKVDKEHKRHSIGSGIGLSLSRQLLIAHGLNYGVESEFGEAVFITAWIAVIVISVADIEIHPLL